MRLQKFEQFIKPGLIRPATLKASTPLDSDAGDDDTRRVKYRGSLFFLKRDQELALTDAMTPLYFNTLRLVVFRGYDYAMEGLL